VLSIFDKLLTACVEVGSGYGRQMLDEASEARLLMANKLAMIVVKQNSSENKA
jgi:hypothetical protein